MKKTKNALPLIRARSIMFLLAVFLAAQFFANSVQAGQIFATNANWKYFKGLSEASSPDPASWRAINFDDSTWLSGNAPFYYDTDANPATAYTGNTRLADMQGGYTCIFMRRTFVVTNVAEISSLKLGAISDDGFFSWINGVPVLTNNMPAGFVAFNGTASGALTEPIPFVTYTLPSPTNYLVEGTNVITIQAFNSSLGASSDFTIDASLLSTAPDFVPPTVTLRIPVAEASVTNLTQITVGFSEPVTGVNASDFRINGVAPTNMTGASDTYTFKFPQPAYGTVQISWVTNHGIFDFGTPAANGFDATGAGATWQYTLVDTVPPTVTELIPLASVTVRSLNHIDVTFNEAVSGVEAGDLLINGSPATNVVALSASHYDFQFTEPSPGQVTVEWISGHGIQDLAVAPNSFAGGNWIYTLDPNALIGGVRINEFVAANVSGLQDEDRDTEDWVELFNFSTNTVSLAGWSLTDNLSNPGKWVFPSVALAPQQFLVVFCSGKDRKPITPGSKLHTNFKLGSEVGYLAFFNSESPRQLLSEFNPYPQQHSDYSYGLDENNQLRYFQVPTPGAPNGSSSISNIVSDTKFSQTRGFFDVGFSLTITCATPGVTIRFTTNGSAPTVSSGFLYTNAIPITNTTVVRAAAFLAGSLPSDVDTHSYIFVNDVIRQADGRVPGPGWPTANSPAGQIYDYGMDTNVVNSPAGATLQSDLKSIPSFSIVMDLNDLFNPSTDPAVGGIYANARGDTIQWERPGSIELIYPEDSQGFHINGGVRIRGGYSRDGTNPKHAFRFFFRQEYGTSKLNYPVFGPTGPSAFNKFDLRTFENYSWSFGGDTRFIALRDQFSRDTQLAMGQQGERGDFFHLYINGQYWGLYNTDERAEANYGSFYYGGNQNDYDTVKVAPDDGYIIYATDGNMDAWTRLWQQATNGFTTDEAYQRVQGNNPDGTPNPAYENLIDVDNLIDYMLLIYWGGNLDAPISNFLGNNSPNNFFAFRDRTGTHGGFRFVAHDSEHTLLNVNEDRTGPFVAGNPSGGGGLTKSNPQFFFQQMWGNLELRMRVADRVQKHLFNGGALSPETALANFMTRSNQIYQAINAESARWGDSKREPPLLRNPDWINTMNFVAGTFIPQRNPVLLNQLRLKGLYPTNLPPVFRQFGGVVPSGYSLFITNSNPSGSIYYTLDGTDPRLRGGDVAPGAISFSDPIVINKQTLVRTRIKDGTNWSALVEATFYVLQDYTKLVISEIMYNPPDQGTNNGDNYEFLELKNSGTNTLDMSGLTFSAGITFNFTNGTLLGPGQFFVLARNVAGFQAKYPGVPIHGVYTGKLDNGGEKVTISHALGTPAVSVTYDDDAPWPAAPDGFGYSLVPMNPNANLDADNAANWRASSAVGGSPGADDPAPAIAQIVINEILTHTAPPDVDSIELFNPTGSPVNIGGWFLTDDRNFPTKYRIPNNTFIGAGGYAVFNETNHFNTLPGATNNFSLSSHGEQVYLFSGDANTNLTGYSYGFDFGAAANGVSFGRYVNSVGEVQYPAQITVSLGMTNSGPRVGPVVINEINYHPGFGFDEFIELRNITASAVKLYDVANPTNTWKLAGLNYTFPPNIEIPAQDQLLIVAISPATFRLKYSVPAGVQILGPYTGTLQDNGERLELKRPDSPDTNGIPYITVDEVRYNDRAPWPPAADGDGASLQRLNSSAYGNDPINWFASGLTPGTPNVFNIAPQVRLISPTNGTVLFIPTTTVNLEATATDTDGTVTRVEFFQEGVKVGEATTSPYTLTISNLSGGIHSFTARATDSGFSTTLSSPVIVTVQFPNTGNGQGLLAEYYDNGGPAFTFNTPADVTLTNATVNFDWGSGRPIPEIGEDTFSVRWTGTIQPRYTDYYRIHGTADDGLRVYFNGTNIIDAWVDQGPTEYTSAPILMTAGQNYHIKMEMYENGGGAAAQLRWSAPFITKEIIPQSQLYPYLLPVITNQPLPQTYAAVTKSATFTANAVGTPPLRAQWYFNGQPISNATNITTSQVSTYTISSAQFTNQGSYQVVFTNAFGSVTSSVANLSVGYSLGITTGITNQTILAGATASFSVIVTGTPPFSYIWRRASTPVLTNAHGLTSDTFSIPNAQLTDSNQYRVIVSSPYTVTAPNSAAILNVLSPPVISVQPTNQSINIGSNVAFRVTASGNPGYGYLWYFNQTNLLTAGTTASSVTVTNVQFTNVGTFSVVITNSLGSVTSQLASLTVGFSPFITQQPQSQSVLAGMDATFSLSVTGSLPVGCVLRRGGVAIAPLMVFNGTNCFVTLTNVQPTNTASTYSILVTNDIRRAGVSSSNFTLTVLYAPVITTQPTNQNARIGSNATFTVIANGNPALSYQWWFNATNLLSSTTNTLSVTNVQTTNAGSYSVVITNSIGSVTSQVASLNLLLPPSIITQPTNQISSAGSNVTFSVTASGEAPLRYQWRRNGSVIAGATNASLVLTSVQPVFSEGSYTVVVTNLLGSATSDTATLIIDSDRDGMPDWYEMANNLDPNSASDANTDADGDHMSNYQEFIAGTDPRDASSYLRIDTDGVVDGGAVLRFLARSNKTYTVQCINSLFTGTWTNIANVASAPTNRTVILTNAPAGLPERYYRLVTPMVP